METLNCILVCSYLMSTKIRNKAESATVKVDQEEEHEISVECRRTQLLPMLQVFKTSPLFAKFCF